MKITKELFGEIGQSKVYSFTFENESGVKVTCINYGCTITKIITPDKNGVMENIVLGYDQLEDYIDHSPYFGCIVGRVAGRIGGATFELDGKTYRLEKNENGNHLHGGAKGFDKVIWDANIIEHEDMAEVQFSYISPDGEEGYPGNLHMKVSYLLNNDNEFIIRYEGISDQKTLLNVTNHSYFNLSGNLKRDVQDHFLTLKSNEYLELNDELLPTGHVHNVEGTTFDFKEGRKIRMGIESEYVQNQLVGNGYDHPFLLSENHNEEIILEDRTSGRKMTVETDEVGVVVYTSNALPEGVEFYGVPSQKYLGVCLETQGLPDAVNHPQFPSWVLEKDQPFSSVTKYTFSQL
ncbi:aldose epimerase family protein [Bacillus sp. FJAT-50079]|uniref:aldose epimerase family protein n=1 Tax=Bacillus sp. FJAT-50079 TaxID=2833577 RepID=UPI001BC942C4|nr:aldose epimerase family protein [Bacillus sp. FJAT-50079]MBS4208256.1 galactose mutarotase [Bacillus sp. FJAT-50079]